MGGNKAQPDFYRRWLGRRSAWEADLANWAATTVGITMSREAELRTGAWKGPWPQEEVLGVVYDLWHEGEMEVEAKISLGRRGGAKPAPRTYETLMVMHVSLRVVDWMIERIGSGRASS